MSFVVILCSALIAIAISYRAGLLLAKGRDLLPLHATEFHLLLELPSIADAREEVRLSTAIAVERSEPLIPLFLRPIRNCESQQNGRKHTIPIQSSLPQGSRFP